MNTISKKFLKSLSICLASILFLIPSVNVFAYENTNQDLAKNEEIILRHLNAPANYLQDYEDSLLFSENPNTGISPFVLSPNGSFYAPNGGTWTYSHGGPSTTTSPSYNNLIKYRKIEYLTLTEVSYLLAANYNPSAANILIGIATQLGISGVKNYIQKTYSIATAAALLKYIAAGTAVYSLVQVLGDLQEAVDYGPIKKAFNSGYGVILEYYQYSYNGSWYYTDVVTKWTEYPYAPLPSVNYGHGNIVSR